MPKKDFPTALHMKQFILIAKARNSPGCFRGKEGSPVFAVQHCPLLGTQGAAITCLEGTAIQALP